MSRPDSEAVEELLARRRALLERVRREPVPKPVLVRELAVSRSTVDRAVRELETARLVRRTTAGVGLTLAGRVALDRYERYRSLLGDLVRTTDVLALLPASVPFDPALVDRATVVSPERHEPRRPVKRLASDIREASRVRSVVSAYIPEVIDAYHAEVVDGSLEADLVVTGDALDVLVRERPGRLDEALDSGLALSRTAVDRLPYCLLVAETDDSTNVIVVVTGDGAGAVGGLLRNDTDAAVAWATRRFERLREDADPIRR